jgi:hypothetical protein
MLNRLIVLTTVLAWVVSKGTLVRKYVQVIENPNPRLLDELTGSTNSTNTTESSNNTELYNFHQVIDRVQFEGTWVNGSRMNDFFSTDSGIMKLQIGVYKITANGREIQMRFIIQNGLYKDSWYMIEQNYLYFFNNDADSDIAYNVTDVDITLEDKGLSFRQSTIKAYNLFYYYMRLGKISYLNLFRSELF